MKFHEFKADGSTIAVRKINRYADEIGKESMDYEVFKTAAEMLDKQMLKSLAQLLDDSDTAPREWVMKTIADHDPDTFKKMYGDQEGYLSVMKPDQNLKDDNTDTAWNKYGLTATHSSKDGKFHSYRHGKLTGSFDSAEELAKHQKELIQNESEPSADAERADAARGMWASSKEIQSRFKTWQDFMNSEDFDEWLDDKFRDEMGEDANDYVEEYDWKCEKCGHTNTFGMTEKDVDEYIRSWEEDNPEIVASGEDTGEGALDWQMNVIKDESGMHYGQPCTNCGTIAESINEDAGEDKDVEKAKQIAKDKAGDMSGASDDIDKVKKGLSTHPDVADALKRANEELNRITKLAGLEEGASMLPYHKHPTDDKLWTFPDAWANDKALDTPYMSNMSMREFLDGLGYDSSFEEAGPVDAKEFIARTTQWLQKNIDKPSQEIPTTVDKSGGGATMIGGGKPEGWMNRQVKHHNELARKILIKYPEVTHFGFN